ncbi:flagellar basal-body rod protein FlgG [Desulfonatronum thiosulfatophilum]|uniref:Flagellar basal-body rod protein FlgG n=1 Tax=Desulfonatronum thiosulfatophilum TaxID=617002 RepID=A0A1G6DIK1_9BACT|nr:flagellar basal-body rod protein FlgG [Desulfonatronum thiosulfatophilum]SDB44956.1 flagellar basal-body rod protein FlgG [Desulfonatronum thiosulfatophilum]
MMRSLWTAASGMMAMQMNIDVTSNNLANISTTGFKKSRAEFEDLMYQTLKIAGAATADGDRIPTGLQVGMGVRPVTVHKEFSVGAFQNTGNPLDLAIEGDGFFQVEANGDFAYTRAGAFKLDNDGRVVTANGYPLQPEFNVPFETQNIVVTENGRIVAMDKFGDELAGADIPLFTFVNSPGLNSIGRNLYLPTEASGDPVEGVPGEENVGSIAQGFLEGSNVDMVEEMVKLITGQRAYEVNSKAIMTSDQMLQTANQIKR